MGDLISKMFLRVLWGVLAIESEQKNGLWKLPLYSWWLGSTGICSGWWVGGSLVGWSPFPIESEAVRIELNCRAPGWCQNHLLGGTEEKQTQVRFSDQNLYYIMKHSKTSLLKRTMISDSSGFSALNGLSWVVLTTNCIGLAAELSKSPRRFH